MPDLTGLQKKLGIRLTDIRLLEQALIHTSYINENPGMAPDSNERLEFLGDAVLGMIMAEKFYHDFPASPEGEMTTLRAQLVRRESLARLARDIGLGDFLYLGKGEETSGGRQKAANLAGVFEAVIAAVYLDQGWDTTRELVLRFFDRELREAATRGAEIDYKSQLQELVQAKQQITPTYHVIEASGPDHDKTFVVEVRVGDKAVGKGAGKNKKSAETEAARNALRKIPGIFTH